MTKFWQSWLKHSLITLLLVTGCLSISVAWWTPSSSAALPAGNAITDGKALLRYSLPIDNQAVRKLQTNLEDIATQLRAGRRWGAISSDLTVAARIVNDRTAKILAGVPEERRAKAQDLIAEIKAGITDLRQAVDTKDKEQIWISRASVLDLVSQLEELMVPEYPFEVPAEYSNLPQLKGRATVEMETDKGALTLVVDGYSAPVTAGNFVDLVQRGFYDGLEFIQAEDYVLQTGDPPGSEQGFNDPATGKYRAIPLEVLVKGDKVPTYGITLEQAGRYREEPVLPFSAYGAIAMARPESDNNGGSSQFFFFLFEPELTPAGRNLLDGRYAVFGYVTNGKEVLEKLQPGDKVKSAKVVQGTENLVQPQIA